MNILDQIVAQKKSEVEAKKSKIPLARLQSEMKIGGVYVSFLDLLRKNRGFHFICEIKKASPSGGIIQSDFDPVRQAKNYVDGGASAISILTDEKYFQGHLDFLEQVRQAFRLPLLRKDFIIDPYQIIESKHSGADIILLIARILTKEQIRNFRQLARELQLDVLLEIAAEEDLAKVADFADIIIGINNRNLKTFEVDLSRSLTIKKHLPEEVPAISESGIRSADDCVLLAENGFRGALIGETLMRAGNPAEVLIEWRKAVAHVHAA